jgi:hypothetical protein
VHVASEEVPIRPAFPRPVAHLLCNRQVLRVVLDGLAKVSLRPIREAEVPVCGALPRPVAHLFCNRPVRGTRWTSQSPPATDMRCCEGWRLLSSSLSPFHCQRRRTAPPGSGLKIKLELKCSKRQNLDQQKVKTET